MAWRSFVKALDPHLRAFYADWPLPPAEKADRSFNARRQVSRSPGRRSLRTAPPSGESVCVRALVLLLKAPYDAAAAVISLLRAITLPCLTTVRFGERVTIASASVSPVRRIRSARAPSCSP
jgi:hypothetical protein